MDVTITRPTVGETYWAPCSDACTSVPLIPGERHGFIVDTPSQAVAVVYSTRTLAELAFSDPTIWHPSNAARASVRAVTYMGGRRFAWAAE